MPTVGTWPRALPTDNRLYSVNDGDLLHTSQPSSAIFLSVSTAVILNLHNFERAGTKTTDNHILIDYSDLRTDMMDKFPA
jgi:hypothetical protein